MNQFLKQFSVRQESKKIESCQNCDQTDRIINRNQKSCLGIPLVKDAEEDEFKSRFCGMFFLEKEHYIFNLMLVKKKIFDATTFNNIQQRKDATSLFLMARWMIEMDQNLNEGCLFLLQAVEQEQKDALFYFTYLEFSHQIEGDLVHEKAQACLVKAVQLNQLDAKFMLFVFAKQENIKFPNDILFEIAKDGHAWARKTVRENFPDQIGWSKESMDNKFDLLPFNDKNYELFFKNDE